MSVKDLAAHIANGSRAKATSQSELVPGKNQVVNNAGGASFQITPWQQLDRFLILGSEGGTYYVSEKKLTKDSAKNVVDLIKADGLRVVNRIVEVSHSGRAPKNDPALLALALAVTYGDNSTKAYAMAKLPEVARIGTHLFHFAEFVNGLRGWGRLLRNGVKNWYESKNTSDLANQVIKYQSRDGWAHRDLIRLSHPKTEDALRNNVYKYVVKGKDAIEYGSQMPTLIIAFEQAKTADKKTLIKLITDHNLTREMIPTEALNDVEVWDALLQKMPMTAMIRNLGKMTEVGLLKPLSSATAKVVESLNNDEALKKARIHPYAVLLATKTYTQGRGIKGSLTWAPVTQVSAALNEAFYKSFGHVRPSGKNTLLALDVSGSMTSPFGGGPLASHEVTAAMSMVTARTEPAYHVMAFSHSFVPLNITPKMSLEDVMKKTYMSAFGGTDCALPMVWAMQNKVEVDTFCVYTDNETWAGKIHPFQALKQYRQQMGRDARLVVVGTAATSFTIADPSDAGMLDVVGFDTAAPNIIADFSRGDV
jgi:60 kDa SS-A/Ro ribonucleoprotein